jgi:hypothetical protein
MPSEIKPANFRLVAMCLNQLRHLVTQSHEKKKGFYKIREHMFSHFLSPY